MKFTSTSVMRGPLSYLRGTCSIRWSPQEVPDLIFSSPNNFILLLFFFSNEIIIYCEIIWVTPNPKNIPKVVYLYVCRTWQAQVNNFYNYLNIKNWMQLIISLAHSLEPAHAPAYWTSSNETQRCRRLLLWLLGLLIKNVS